MRTLKKVIAPVFLCFALLLSTSVSAADAPQNGSSADSVASGFVMNFIREPEHATYSNWSDETEIASTITIYDAEGNVAGKIFDLNTAGEASGYVEIVLLNQKPVVKAYSYNGVNAVVGHAKQLGYQIDPYDEDLSVISLGGLDYAVKDVNNPDVVLDLYSGKYVAIDEETLQTYCEAQLETMTKAFEEQQALETQASREIANSSDIVLSSAIDFVEGPSSIDLVKTSDFPGYSDHCSPTAGTNIIKYYHDIWGINFLDDLDYTFELLYDFMGTNTTITGTDRTKIITGLRAYFNYYYATYDFSGTTTTPTLTLIRNYIARNCPVLMSVDDFGGTSGGHSIVAFGSNQTSVVVSTGWDAALHTYTYSLLDVARLTYIGFDFASRGITRRA